MVQHCVNVMEGVPLGDARVRIADAKLVERPIGNVLASVGAVFVVGVERGNSPFPRTIRANYFQNEFWFIIVVYNFLAFTW